MAETSLKRYAVIVAGGSGTRMQSSVPKQFLLLEGKPVLMHTLQAFMAIPAIHIVLVLPRAHFQTWARLCKQHSFTCNATVVEGGDTRFHSVRNGLEHVADGLVAIHDGARPMVSPALIERSFALALQNGNAVAAVKVRDSLRELTLTGGSRNANRNNYYMVQTPQTFKTDEIKQAYREATHFNFTDDAGVLEEVLGKRIHLIDGEYQNLKITGPVDLLIAAALINAKTD
jgi:2-C-methyl-D-erythritol 4-phosphate cytidylyltransferase